MKSTLRQRARTLLLAILVGAAAFALVARVTEFVIVRDALERVMGFYRAVGILSPLRSDNFTTDHDVTRALDIIEGNRHVAISDTRRFTQGVMDGVFNTVAHEQPNFFNPVKNDVDIPVMDHYFFGYITIIPHVASRMYNPFLILQISTELLLLGDPSVMRNEDIVFTNERGQTSTIISRYAMRLHVSDEDGERLRRGDWSPLDGLEAGELALFRATRVPCNSIHAVEWHLQPVDEETGVFFISASDEEAVAAALDNLYEEFALLRENMSSVAVKDTHDMTAMPRFMNPRLTWIPDTPRLYGGRMLTYADYGQPVTAISVQLATRRGLRVGDTLTITLRDNPYPTWIDSPTASRWARGLENWWDNNPQGWWVMNETAHYNRHAFPAYTLDLEVVGIYMFMPPFFTNFTMSEIFVPAGVIPAGFGWENAPQLTGMYSFVLDSPRHKDEFMRDTRAALYELGFVASFIPTGFDALAAAIDPIRFSVTVNLVVFGAAALLIFFFVIFLYIRHWRKSIAIARALGIPANTVLRQLFTPVVAFWMPAMVAGSVTAWFFAMGQARDTLGELAAYDVQAVLALYWLVIFTAVVGAVIGLGVGWGGYRAAHSPVLVQLQGDISKQVKAVDAGTVPAGFAMGAVTLTPLARHTRAARRAAVRYCMRNMARTPVKTLLLAAASFILVFSLGWLHNLIRLNDAEVQRLWDTTIVEAELLVDLTEARDIHSGAVISPNTWDMIAYSGFVGDAYVEAVAAFEEIIFMGVSHLPGFVNENTKTVSDEQVGVICADMEITFLPGFSADDFIYTPGAPMPLVIRHEMAAGALPDGAFAFLGQTAQVIGYFHGGLERAVNRFGQTSHLYVMPIGAHRARFSGVWPFHGAWDTFDANRPPYMTARFSIDPARNREIDAFRNQIEPFMPENSLGAMGGIIPLILFIDDDILHGVVMPMERNLELLQILYPIAVALTFILAVGLNLLSMLPNAKNAAIMRALGKTRGKTRFNFCLGQLVVCLLGVLAGLGALFIFGAGGTAAPLLQAVMYVSGGILGAVIGAVIITAKKPMELLQIRE